MPLSTESPWDAEIAQFLSDLSLVQEESLEVLAAKRELLVAYDLAGLAAIGQREEQLIARLQECLERRETLLKRAADEGLPAESVRSLAAALPKSGANERNDQLHQAAVRARLLQHQSLTNWVVAQRTLIHLSQLLEIIATGGRLKPTYSRDDTGDAEGALVDHVA